MYCLQVSTQDKNNYAFSPAFRYIALYMPPLRGLPNICPEGPQRGKRKSTACPFGATERLLAPASRHKLPSGPSLFRCLSERLSLSHVVGRPEGHIKFLPLWGNDAHTLAPFGAPLGNISAGRGLCYCPPPFGPLWGNRLCYILPLVALWASHFICLFSYPGGAQRGPEGGIYCELSALWASLSERIRQDGPKGKIKPKGPRCPEGP